MTKKEGMKQRSEAMKHKHENEVEQSVVGEEERLESKSWVRKVISQGKIVVRGDVAERKSSQQPGRHMRVCPAELKE